MSARPVEVGPGVNDHRQRGDEASLADRWKDKTYAELGLALTDAAMRIDENDGRLTADSSADLDMAMDDLEEIKAEIASRVPHALDRMVAEVQANNVAHGWYEADRTFGDDVALLVTELGEAMDAFREYGMADQMSIDGLRLRRGVTTESGAILERFRIFEGFLSLGDPGPEPLTPAEMDVLAREGIGKPEGVGSEVADILIRLLDTCGRRKIDLVAQYERKMAYNRTRPHKHGGKAL